MSITSNEITLNRYSIRIGLPGLLLRAMLSAMT